MYVVITEAETTSPGVYLSVPTVSCYLNKILYDNSFSYTPVNRLEHDVEIFKRVFSFFCFTPRRTIDSHRQMDTICSFFLKLLPLMYCEKYDWQYFPTKRLFAFVIYLLFEKFQTNYLTFFWPFSCLFSKPILNFKYKRQVLVIVIFK